MKIVIKYLFENMSKSPALTELLSLQKFVMNLMRSIRLRWKIKDYMSKIVDDFTIYWDKKDLKRSKKSLEVKIKVCV